MAQRILKAQIRPVDYKIDENVDMIVTKPGLSLTPSQIKDLTDRGVAVSLPNAKQFLDTEVSINDHSWEVDPVFKRDTDMIQLWEIEKAARGKVLRAHKSDKKRFG